MKNMIKLLTIIAFVTVVGFLMTACPPSEDSDDVFAGTWVYQNEDELTKIEAHNGDFAMFYTFYYEGFDDSDISEEYERHRGTYKVDGNTVTLTITQVNSSAGEDEWTNVSDLTEDVKKDKIFVSKGTLSGDKFNFQNVPFTRQ